MAWTNAYHGTTSPFRAFRFRLSDVVPSQIGVWFASRFEVATRIATSIQRADPPRVVTAQIEPGNARKYPTYADFLADVRDAGGAATLRRRLIRKGFNSVEITRSDTDGAGERTDWAVFARWQIRIVQSQEVTPLPALNAPPMSEDDYLATRPDEAAAYPAAFRWFLLPASAVVCLDPPFEGPGCGGDCGWHVDSLIPDIAANGLREAVEVGRSLERIEHGDYTMYAHNGNHRLTASRFLQCPYVLCESSFADEATPLTIKEIVALGGRLLTQEEQSFVPQKHATVSAREALAAYERSLAVPAASTATVAAYLPKPDEVETLRL